MILCLFCVYSRKINYDLISIWNSTRSLCMLGKYALFFVHKIPPDLAYLRNIHCMPAMLLKSILMVATSSSWCSYPSIHDQFHSTYDNVVERINGSQANIKLVKKSLKNLTLHHVVVQLAFQIKAWKELVELQQQLLGWPPLARHV